MVNQQSIKRCVVLIFMWVIAFSLLAQSFDGPDFNGDGSADLASVWSDRGQLSAGLLLSGKNGVSESNWVHRTGTYDQTQRWFTGDFNGDQLSDTACLWETNGRMSCAVYLSSDVNSDFINDTFKKSVWADQSGPFEYSDKWFIGDFNGDYKTDLARVYREKGKRSVQVYLSNGSGFEAPVKWVDQQGLFHADDIWLTGSFDPIRGTDFAVVDAGQNVSISMFLSTGTAFNSTNWVKDAGARLTSMKWVAEDFNGDGATDIANLWNDDGLVSIDVHCSYTNCFTNQSWAVKQGVFEREHRWLVGDFNGDAKVDIARLMDDDGKLSIESYESNGKGFTVRSIFKQGMPCRDQNSYSTGDFNGDSRTDLAVTWADETNQYCDVIFSSGELSTVKRVFTAPLADYFDRHPLVRPILGDTFLNYAMLSGATPVGADLQAVLNSGNDLLLVKRQVYNTSQPIKYQTAYQSVKTMDALFISDFAIIRQQIDQGDYDTLINGNEQNYIHLESVRVDGNKYTLGQKGKLATQAQGAMVFFSHAKGVWIRRCVMYNSRTWSTCHLVESGDASDHIAEHSYVLGAGDDPRGCGKYVDASGIGVSSEVSIGWSDGFSISATNVTARYNFIMDCTDVGLVLFGAPGSHVHDNLILNVSRDNHGGINLVDDSAHRYIGMDSTFGKEYKCYDYRNLTIENNRVVASGCRIQIGMPIGNRTWKRVGPAVFDLEGSVIRNNLLEGDSMGYGYVIDYAKNINFYGNKSIATHSGKGRGTSDNKNDPDPAMAFLYDPAHIHVAPGGTLQEGFVTNAKPIEHLLFHNGTPLTAERYHYYEYTDMEAADMVKMAYLEMLGRQPTEQELLDGKNSFLIDPKPETLINEAQKQYGDAFRRELMKRPEFIQKFGEVATQNLQSFRVSRWRDRIQAIDKASILKTGHFAHPSAVYDRVLAQLIYTPTEANAEIVKVSPELPEKMAKGESVQIAVTVKNTGKTAWENKANQPARFALASVGDDTTFGFTRADLPDDVSVLPGQSYTFHLKLTAPPVRWAGKDKSTATLFPYNLKMIQESVGNFGETLASHAGKIPQIAVIHVAQPPPESVYNSTFISQILQGDPQIHGIRPGAKFVVNLTFKNAGSSTTEAWSKSKGFSLGSENAKDNRTWGNNRIALDDAVVVPYGETVTIQGVLTAPLEEGTYNFQWQLLGAGWFGQKSENLSITVSPTAPVIELTDSQFVSMKIPKQVTSDKPFAAEVTFKNAGTTAWSDGELSPVVSLMDQTDEPYAVITSQHSDSVREETADKLFDNDPSTKYFTRNASAWIQHQFASKARHKVVKYSITSAPDAGPGEELMANGSFEEGIEGWKLVPGASLSTNDAVFGSASLMVSSQAGKNIGNSTFTLQGLKPNTDYALSFWMRQEPDMQGAFVIDTEDVFDRTCQWVKNGGQPTVWTRYRGLFNTAAVDAGKQANPTSLTIRVRSDALIGTFYVDGISLVETSGGGMKGDPQQWILHGSNDGTTWTMVDSRNGIEFSARSQRQMFEVVQPGEYEFYRFDAKNWGGGTLQFGEIELYTEPAKSLWTGTPRASMTAGEVIPPGTNYTFTLNLTAPAKAGTFEFQGRMMQKGSAEAVGMGAYTPVYSVQVLPEK